MLCQNPFVLRIAFETRVVRFRVDVLSTAYPFRQFLLFASAWLFFTFFCTNALMAQVRSNRDSIVRKAIRSAGATDGALYNGGYEASFLGVPNYQNFAQLTECAELRSIVFRNTELSDAQLSLITPLKQITSLEISNEGTSFRSGHGIRFSTVTDQGIAMLRNMPQLKELKLTNLRITQKSLETIVALPHLESLSLVNLPISAADLHLVSRLNLTSLELGGEQIVSEVLGFVPSSRLEKLRLRECPITDYSTLMEFPRLESLRIDNCFLTPVMVRGFERLKSLQNLELRGRFDDRTVDQLQYLSGIKSLSLDSDSVSEQCVVPIAKMDSLENLKLRGRQFGDGCLTQLLTCQNLTSLELSITQVTNNGVARLADFPRLQNLTIVSATGISDGSVRHLEKLSNLRTLHLISTKITRSGASRLERSLPKCDVYCHQ